MKKIFMMLPLFAAFLMTGCNNDDSLGASEGQGIKKETVSFNATIDNDDERITFNENDGRKVYWEEDDAVLVVSNTDDSRYIYEVSEIYDNHAQAFFSPQVEGEGLGLGETGKAYYPTTILGDDGKLVLPAVQNFAPEHKISDITPMYADITEDNTSTPAHFSNLCGLLRINITGPATGVNTVKRITVTADEPMSGEFEIQEANGTYVAVLKEQTGNPGITLECETPVTLSSEESTSFYIAVPEGEYHHVTVTTISADESVEAYVKSLKVDKTLTIARNTRYNMNYTVSYKEQPILLTGTFKVGDDKYVQFTRGNLFWDGNHFGLEPHQYDTHPEQSEASSKDDAKWTVGHMSHFWWSETCEGSYHLFSAPSYIGHQDANLLFTNNPNSGFSVYGRTDLRVLEGKTNTPYGADEWNYLFTNQEYDLYAKSNRAFTVDGMNFNGIFVYPYGWQKAVDGKVGDSHLDTWSEIDEAGILFLPSCGVRSHRFSQGDAQTITAIQGYCRYWGAVAHFSSTESTLYCYGPYMESGEGTFKANGGNKGNYAMPIRLVKDCTVPPMLGTMSDSYNRTEDQTSNWGFDKK